MLRDTIWRDLRWRLLAATMLVMPLTALLSWSYAARLHAGGAMQSSYLTYLDDGWFHLPGPSAVFLLMAVILGAGRVTQPRDQTAYLLALPISRRRLLFTHVAAAVTAVAVLILLADLVLAVGAWSAGQTFPVVAVILRSVGVLVAAVPWVCVATGVILLVRHPLLAIVLVIGAVVMLPADRFRLDIPPAPSTSMLAPWDAWAFADPRAWHGGIPVSSLLVAAVLGVGGALFALHRLERFEP